MNTKLFQLYDRKAETVIGPIMSMPKEAPAIREFHAVLNMKDSQPGRYPEDFVLLILGEQDETGALTPHKFGPDVIATGEAWAEQKSDSQQTSLSLNP